MDRVRSTWLAVVIVAGLVVIGLPFLGSTATGPTPYPRLEGEARTTDAGACGEAGERVRAITDNGASNGSRLELPRASCWAEWTYTLPEGTTGLFITSRPPIDVSTLQRSCVKWEVMLDVTPTEQGYTASMVGYTAPHCATDQYVVKTLEVLPAGNYPASLPGGTHRLRIEPSIVEGPYNNPAWIDSIQLGGKPIVEAETTWGYGGACSSDGDSMRIVEDAQSAGGKYMLFVNHQCYAFWTAELSWYTEGLFVRAWPPIAGTTGQPECVRWEAHNGLTGELLGFTAEQCADPNRPYQRLEILRNGGGLAFQPGEHKIRVDYLVDGRSYLDAGLDYLEFGGGTPPAPPPTSPPPTTPTTKPASPNPTTTYPTTPPTTTPSPVTHADYYCNGQFQSTPCSTTPTPTTTYHYDPVPVSTTPPTPYPSTASPPPTAEPGPSSLRIEAESRSRDAGACSADGEAIRELVGSLEFPNDDCWAEFSFTMDRTLTGVRLRSQSPEAGSASVRACVRWGLQLDGRYLGSTSDQCGLDEGASTAVLEVLDQGGVPVVPPGPHLLRITSRIITGPSYSNALVDWIELGEGEAEPTMGSSATEAPPPQRPALAPGSGIAAVLVAALAAGVVAVRRPERRR